MTIFFLFPTFISLPFSFSLLASLSFLSYLSCHLIYPISLLLYLTFSLCHLLPFSSHSPLTLSVTSSFLPPLTFSAFSYHLFPNRLSPNHLQNLNPQSFPVAMSVAISPYHFLLQCLLPYRPIISFCNVYCHNLQSYPSATCFAITSNHILLRLLLPFSSFISFPNHLFQSLLPSSRFIQPSFALSKPLFRLKPC